MSTSSQLFVALAFLSEKQRKTTGDVKYVITILLKEKPAGITGKFQGSP